MGAPSRGELNCRWIEAYCFIPEGKFVGQKVRLRPWQRDIIKGIYDTPTRRAIVSFGRKNAKTTLAAFLLILHLCGPEARQNSQLFSDAQSRDQASLLFNLAAKVIRQSPDLRRYISIRETAKQLACAELGTLYRALSAEASTAYGLSPVFTIHDELGQVRGPRSELYEALETASGAQDNPLSIIISTQAPNKGDLLSMLIDEAATGADSRTKLFLYTADESLDPFSEEAIRAANPAYGDFLNAEEVRDQAESARRMPAREAAYRNLILNQRVEAQAALIPRSAWEACRGSFSLDDFGKATVYVGLDLSSTQDLTAMLLVFPRGGKLYAWPYFWLPADGLRDRADRDKVPYDVWADQGWLETTPGKAVDKAWVSRRCMDIVKRFKVAVVAYDRWRIDEMKGALSHDGINTEPGGQFPLEPFGQGFKDMAPAVDALEKAVLNLELVHNGNPILQWCAANAVVTIDPAGNRKLDKAKATGRIDGMVALAMAVAKCAAAAKIAPSVYEERGVLVL